jgi:hypothetical protein
MIERQIDTHRSAALAQPGIGQFIGIDQSISPGSAWSIRALLADLILIGTHRRARMTRRERLSRNGQGQKCCHLHEPQMPRKSWVSGLRGIGQSGEYVSGNAKNRVTLILESRRQVYNLGMRIMTLVTQKGGAGWHELPKGRRIMEYLS